MSHDLRYCVRQIRARFNEADLDGCGSAFDLCNRLKDGELLCRLLAVLSNGIVLPESTYSCNSVHLSRLNVQFFLENCAEHLGLPNLFEPDDLLQLNNPNRVLHALRCLLKHTATPGQEQQKEEEEKEEEGKEGEEEEEEESTYAIIDGESKEFSEICYIIREMVNTERNYTDTLLKLLQIRQLLLSPLSAWQTDQVDMVFKHVDDLLELHQSLADRLESLVEKGPERFCAAIGCVFTETLEHLGPFYEAVIPDQALVKTILIKMFKESSMLRENLETAANACGVEAFTVKYDMPLKQLFNHKNLLERLQPLVSKEFPNCQESASIAFAGVNELLRGLNEIIRQREIVERTGELLAVIENLPEDVGSVENVGQHTADSIFKVKIGNNASDLGRCFCLLTVKYLIVARQVSNMRYEYVDCFAVNNFLDAKVEGGEKLKIFYSDQPIQLRGVDSAKWQTLINNLLHDLLPKEYSIDNHKFRLGRSRHENLRCSQCRKKFDSGNGCCVYSCSHCELFVHYRCLKQLGRGRRFSLPILCTISPFYHKINRVEAEKKLRGQEIGDFLLRPRSKNVQQIVMVVKKTSDSCGHIIVNERTTEDGRKEYSLCKSQVWHNSINSLIEFYSNRSMTVHFPAFDFHLGRGVPSNSAFSSRANAF